MRHPIPELYEADLTNEDFKFCPACQNPRPKSEFYPSTVYKDKLSRTCKTCSREYQRKRNRKNRLLIQALQKGSPDNMFSSN